MSVSHRDEISLHLDITISHYDVITTVKFHIQTEVRVYPILKKILTKITLCVYLKLIIVLVSAHLKSIKSNSRVSNNPHDTIYKLKSHFESRKGNCKTSIQPLRNRENPVLFYRVFTTSVY